MIIFESPSLDPRWNLALEEYFFEYMDPRQSYLLLWRNRNTVVIGKNQNTASEIDGDYVREHDITVVRRLSGGGAVYHDDGNLNFTFITDAPEDGKIDLHRFCVPVAETLRSLGVAVEISGRNDMLVDGKKFSGNAQYVRRGRVMHHGTLMFDSDLSVLGNVLRANKEKIRSKGVASTVSRVTNLRPYLPENVTMADFSKRLKEYFAATDSLEEYSLEDADLKTIQRLKEERYDTWEWNYGKFSECDWSNSERVEGCGCIQAQLRVENGEIRDLLLRGDFFGNGDVDELTSQLEGCRFSREAVMERLQDIPVEYYIHRLTKEKLAELLTP